MITTDKEHTFSAIYPRTRKNTYYGYEVTKNHYEWWRSKQTAIKHIPNKFNSILRATLIGDTMNINLRYLKFGGWR